MIAALEANEPRLRAQDRLDQAIAGHLQLSEEGWFNTALEATGSEEVAQAYFNAAVRRAMDARANHR